MVVKCRKDTLARIPGDAESLEQGAHFFLVHADGRSVVQAVQHGGERIPRIGGGA